MMMIFKSIFKLVFLVLFIIFHGLAYAQEKLVLEDFEKQTVGKVDFNGWHVSNVKGNAHDIYSIVKENNNMFLHADSRQNAAVAFKIKGWSLKYRPVISWKWRVHEHPKGGKPLSKPNNSAASIYVIFRKSLIPLRFHTLKYVWAEDEAVGEYVFKKGKNQQALVVIRSGKNNMGEWITEERNVLEDYKKYFKTSKAKSPVAFGILTDSERVKNGHAVADYDDFILLKKASKKTMPTINKQIPQVTVKSDSKTIEESKLSKKNKSSEEEIKKEPNSKEVFEEKLKPKKESK